MVRFDWYQATVRAETPDIRACLASQLGSGAAWELMRKAPHGYAFGERLADGSGPLAMLWYGGTHARPHVVFSGESAQPGAELLRAEFPDHAVTRLDPCIDYGEPGAYDRLQGIALGVAEAKRIKVGTAGDHLLTKEGRTLYLGAPSSHTRMRLYDKAAELRGKFAHDPVRLAQVPSELARLECQVRPQTRQAKEGAAIMDPLSVMGSAAWMRELMRQVAGLELEPFEAGKVWRQSDDDRAYAAMLAQYGGLVRRLIGLHGSPECFGLQVAHDLAEREAFAAKQRRRG